jgi:hypothetical protein
MSTVNAVVWMTPKEIAAVEALADVDNRDFSSWMRNAVLLWFNLRPKTRPPTPKSKDVRTIKRFRISKFEKKGLKWAAGLHDLTLSNWIRNVAVSTILNSPKRRAASSRA